MGQAARPLPVRLLHGVKGEDLEQIHDRALLDYTEKHSCEVLLQAPETYSPDTPSLSSLEMYAIERTTAGPAAE